MTIDRIILIDQAKKWSREKLKQCPAFLQSGINRSNQFIVKKFELYKCSGVFVILIDQTVNTSNNSILWIKQLYYQTILGLVEPSGNITKVTGKSSTLCPLLAQAPFIWERTRCRLRWLRKKKLFLHRTHWKGFSRLCTMLMCCLRFPLVLRSFSHWGQAKGPARIRCPWEGVPEVHPEICEEELS